MRHVSPPSQPRICAWLVLASSLLGCAEAPERVSPLALSSAQAAQQVSLAGHVEVLVEPGQAWTAREAAAQEGYRATARHHLSFGLNENAHWLRFTVDAPRAGLLEVDYAPLDHVDLYRLAGDGFDVQRAGDAVPHGAWPRDHRVPTFELPAGRHTYLMRVQSTSPVEIPLRWSSEEAHARAARFDAAWHWGLLGLLLGLALYNLFLFVSLRDRSYLWYVLYIASVSGLSATHAGLGFQMLWPDATWWNSVGIVVLIGASIFFMAGFTRSFLSLGLRMPRADQAMQVVAAVALAHIVLTPFVFGALWQVLGALLVLGILAFACTLGVLRWRAGFSSARWFLLAYGAMSLGVAISILNALDVLPPVWVSAEAFQIAFAVEGLLLSLALGDRVQRYRRALERHRRLLEEEVAERTEALSRANTSLRAEIAARAEREAEHAQLTEEMRHRQQLEALGRLAGGVAHDMNNVLGSIVGFATLLEQELPDGSRQHDDAAAIVRSAVRGRDLTANLLGFARRGKRIRTQVSLHTVVADALTVLRGTFRERVEVALHLDAPRDIVEGDPHQLAHAITNVCLNGVDAMGGEGELTIASRVDAGRLVLEIRDRGCGMSDETMIRAFEPFFTKRPTGVGTGLGLSMVYGCIESHEGTITLESVVGAGTTAIISLPLSEAAPVERQSAVPVERARSGRVLVVDDERPLARATKRLLKRLGFEPECVHGGVEALAKLEQGERYDLVMLDMVMPKMDGPRTFAAIRARLPEQRVLIMSGYTEAEVTPLIADGAKGFLPKPFDVEGLARAVDQALEE